MPQPFFSVAQAFLDVTLPFFTVDHAFFRPFLCSRWTFLHFFRPFLHSCWTFLYFFRPFLRSRWTFLRFYSPLSELVKMNLIRNVETQCIASLPRVWNQRIIQVQNMVLQFIIQKRCIGARKLSFKHSKGLVRSHSEYCFHHNVYHRVHIFHRTHFHR